MRMLPTYMYEKDSKKKISKLNTHPVKDHYLMPQQDLHIIQIQDVMLKVQQTHAN